MKKMLLIVTLITWNAGILAAQTATAPASGDGTSGDPGQNHSTVGKIIPAVQDVSAYSSNDSEKNERYPREEIRDTELRQLTSQYVDQTYEIDVCYPKDYKVSTNLAVLSTASKQTYTHIIILFASPAEKSSILTCRSMMSSTRTPSD